MMVQMASLAVCTQVSPISVSEQTLSEIPDTALPVKLIDLAATPIDNSLYPGGLGYRIRGGHIGVFRYGEVKTASTLST
jgi:hypothetical protein